MSFIPHAASPEETTAAAINETTAVPPGKTPNSKEREKKKSIKFKLSVCEFLAFILVSEMVTKIKINCTLFRVATEGSTAAPVEETTAVPPGKSPNNMVKEKKKLFC